AEELLELVALEGAGDKRVAELSGGQRQRVAIARALAVEPKVMLLDEPLSALDLKLRQHMRAELRAIQRRTGVTFIYITHDQGEALHMSDRIAVMSRGRIEQVGSPSEIYDRPGTAFVASFVGESNIFQGRVRSAMPDEVVVETGIGAIRGRNPAGLQAGDRAMMFVRPERTSLSTVGDHRITARLVDMEFEGSFASLRLLAGGRQPILVQMPNDGRLDALRKQAEVGVEFLPEAAIALPEGSLAR
ncbi:MAG: ABC transporter ATP-binding protein, partial [Rhodospirillaceae bacterium]|nr:ABC transporter ATP-binding protein [Rhodospirillaceae bacterium]